jgi:pyocin large subunit-like protein
MAGPHKKLAAMASQDKPQRTKTKAKQNRSGRHIDERANISHLFVSGVPKGVKTTETVTPT